MALEIVKGISTTKPYFRNIRVEREGLIVCSKRFLMALEVVKGIAAPEPCFR